MFPFRKYNSSVTVFKYEVFEFIDCHHFYSAEYVQNKHQKLKKNWSYID